jgi:hypothetical protein
LDPQQHSEAHPKHPLLRQNYESQPLIPPNRPFLLAPHLPAFTFLITKLRLGFKAGKSNYFLPKSGLIVHWSLTTSFCSKRKRKEPTHESRIARLSPHGERSGRDTLRAVDIKIAFSDDPTWVEALGEVWLKSTMEKT